MRTAAATVTLRVTVLQVVSSYLILVAILYRFAVSEFLGITLHQTSSSRELIIQLVSCLFLGVVYLGNISGHIQTVIDLCLCTPPASVAPLGNQAAGFLTQYPAQSHYHDT